MSPTVIAAIITGSCALVGAVTAALIKKGRRKKAEEANNATPLISGDQNAIGSGIIQFGKGSKIKVKGDIKANAKD